MAELPSGTVTFLFTDLESSTRLWEDHPDAMHGALARHDEIVRAAIELHAGQVVKTTGDGFHAAFATARDAIDAAVAGELALAAEQWDVTGPLRVRMGIHTGEAQRRAGDYYGPALNRAARLANIAHGGQVVVSGAAEDLVRDALPNAISLVDLGQHRLRDLGRPEHVFQVCHPDLVNDFPPLRSVEAYPTNLPLQLTSFVGRDDELVEVAEALDDARIVTLTGVGGVGKTRLAVQTAAELLPLFSGGAWLVEFGPLSDAAAVPDLVATALSIPPRPGEDLIDGVVGALRDRELLLVLDNCEHLIVAAARLVDTVTRSCPRVRVLATSREGLGIAGERLLLVRSLSVPDDDVGLDLLVASDAFRLFVDRASDARRGFAATAENTSAIAQLCRRLDGIPLAIELAAARTRMMSPAEIARRLDERFRLLTGGSRTAVERHQTLRAAVDWSYALLDAEEQSLLDALGVFAGGFTLEAAEAVAFDDDEVLGRLGQLVDKSLVVADEDADGTTRYRLLETIRQYALEHLEVTGKTDVVRRRHAEFYVAFLVQSTAAVPGPTDAETLWVQATDREMANLRVALDWAIGIDDADTALGLAVPLGEFGAPRPRYTIARWIAPVLDMPSARRHPLRPQAAAWVAHSVSGNVAARSARLREMDVAFDEVGLDFTSAAHQAHASLAFFTGDSDDAIEHATKAADLALTAGDRRWAAVYNGLLANTLVALGHTEDGIERGELALALASEIGSRSVPGEAALGLALSDIDPDRALAHLEAAWSLCQEQGNENMRYVSGTCLANMLVDRGDVQRALEMYDALLNGAIETLNPMFVTLACDSLGIALSKLGNPAAAAVMFGALERQARTLHGIRREQHDAALETTRDAIDPASLKNAVARGRGMTTEQLLAFAKAEVARRADETP